MTNPDFCYVIFSFAFRTMEFQPTLVFYYRVILVIILCIERFTLPLAGKIIHFDVLNFLYSAVLSIKLRISMIHSPWEVEILFIWKFTSVIKLWIILNFVAFGQHLNQDGNINPASRSLHHPVINSRTLPQ